MACKGESMYGYFSRMFRVFLAWNDRVINNFLLQDILISRGPGSSREETYLVHLGPRIAIVRNDGTLRIGGLFEVTHKYDEQGKFVSRIPLLKSAAPGEKIIFGTRNVNEAYLKTCA